MLILYNLLLGFIFKLCVWLNDIDYGRRVKAIILTILGVIIGITVILVLLIDLILLQIIGWLTGADFDRSNAKFYEFAEEAEEEWKSLL